MGIYYPPMIRRPYPLQELSQRYKVTLRYTLDCDPGIKRIKIDDTYHYLDPHNRIIRNNEILDRIKKLAIPPAWTDVWICPLINGHLQVTGRDNKGRKQYLYHKFWQEVHQELKFNKMILFGEKLQLIRNQVEHDLSLPYTDQRRILATIIWLLDQTNIRVGNDEYAKKNKSYGLTTLEDKHVHVSGHDVNFEFIGKSGVKHVIGINHPLVAHIVRRCKDIPGYRLFQYYTHKGQKKLVESGDVNNYLKEITKEEITAKDFRTWAGTILSASYLYSLDNNRSKREIKKDITQAVIFVSDRLGNTPSICKKYYMHPEIIRRYEARELKPLLREELVQYSERNNRHLKAMEFAILHLLEKC